MTRISASTSRVIVASYRAINAPVTVSEDNTINPHAILIYLIALVARIEKPAVGDHQLHAVRVLFSYPISKVADVAQLVHIASAVRSIADLKRLILLAGYYW